MQKVKVLILTILCAFVFAVNVQAEGEKIGILDLSRSFDEYVKTKEFDAILSEKTESFKKERGKKIAELDELKGKLALIKEEEKGKLKKELEEKSDSFFAYDQAQQTDLRKERDEKVREILLEIETTVNEYAEKEGFDIILNDRVLIFGDKSLDITDDVLKVLNDKYNKK